MPAPKSQVHTFQGNDGEQFLVELEAPGDKLPCELVEIDDRLLLLVPLAELDGVTVISCEIHKCGNHVSVNPPILYGAIHDPTTNSYHTSLPLPRSAVLRRL